MGIQNSKGCASRVYARPNTSSACVCAVLTTGRQGKAFGRAARNSQCLSYLLPSPRQTASLFVWSLSESAATGKRAFTSGGIDETNETQYSTIRGENL